jgi:hypothetical protein
VAVAREPAEVAEPEAEVQVDRHPGLMEARTQVAVAEVE